MFVEGPDDKYRKAKEMIDEIIRNQKQTSNTQTNVHVGEVNPFSTHHNRSSILKFEIPSKMVGLIIGKQTETLKSVAMKSNTRIFIH